MEPWIGPIGLLLVGGFYFLLFRAMKPGSGILQRTESVGLFVLAVGVAFVGVVIVGAVVIWAFRTVFV
jgi:hypothetical protein